MAVVAYLKVLTWHSPGETEGNQDEIQTWYLYTNLFGYSDVDSKGIGKLLGA